MAQLNAWFVYKGKRVDILDCVDDFDINNALDIIECGNFSNSGAGKNIAITLPPAIPGRYHEFHVMAAHYLKITPHGSEKVSNHGGVGNKTNVRCNTVGASIRFLCVKKGVWYTVGAVGSWAQE